MRRAVDRVRVLVRLAGVLGIEVLVGIVGVSF